MASFAYKHVFFFAQMTLQEIQGLFHLLPEKKILVKNVKKHRKYFQMEEDGLIFCLRDANKRRFAEQRITKRRKLAM